MNVNGHSTCFKLDIGAPVSVISDKEPWLVNQQVLKGPDGTLLSVVGQFKATLEYRNRSLTEPVCVLRNQLCSLFSRKACVDLGLIFGADEVSNKPTELVREFPRLFPLTRLGKLKTEHHITLEPVVKPVRLYAWKDPASFIAKGQD